MAMGSKNKPNMNLPVREIVPVHWPITLPAHATFAIQSPQPIQIRAPYAIQIHSTSPIQIYCDRKLSIIPAGPATPGFARGWLKLPVELKLAILRHNLTFSVTIWPSNVNAVIRNHLLPYLQMTPDIADIAKAVFYRENQFIVQFSSSTPRYDFSLVKPPMAVRSQLRRIKFLTRLTDLDWRVLRSMAEGEDRAGFTNLVHLEVRCLLKEAVTDYKSFGRTDTEDDIGAFEEDSSRLWGTPIKFSCSGEVVYDVSGYDSTGNWEENVATLVWMQVMKDSVNRNITFRNT